MSKWSTEEVNILKKYYPYNKPISLVTLLPNKNLASIYRKANRMGLKTISLALSHEDYLVKLAGRNIEVLDIYINAHTKLRHKCLICSNIWIAKPNDVGNISKSGCPICNNAYGFKSDKDNYPSKASIYLLKIELKDEIFLKLGITTTDITRRINSLKYSIGKDLVNNISIEYIKEGNGFDVYRLEQDTLSENIKFISKYKFDGNTELLPLESLNKIIKEIS